MFNNLFTKKGQKERADVQNSNSTDPSKEMFKKLVLSYLLQNGISDVPLQASNNRDFISDALEHLGFSDLMEKVIMKKWHESKNLAPAVFSEEFVNDYKYFYLAEFAHEDVIKRNNQLVEVYDKIIAYIMDIQSYLENEELRTRVESDFRTYHDAMATMFQCTTPFCMVSLGCSTKGRYNIMYSLDYEILQMIPNSAVNDLLRRIYELTSGELVEFLRIGSLCTNCVQVFKTLVTEAGTLSYHKLIRQELT
jgi:bacterioferritin-associated ferredoxin